MPPLPPHVLDSAVPGAVWPALPTAANAYLLALMFQLSESQWRGAEELERHQFCQAADLLAHAARFVPYYKDRLDAVPKAGLDAEAWRRLPLLRRTDVQAHMEDLPGGVPELQQAGIRIYRAAVIGQVQQHRFLGGEMGEEDVPVPSIRLQKGGGPRSDRPRLRIG